MGALSFASRVVPGAGAFELSRSSRRNRVALNVRKSPVAALNARPETRWTDPPPFPEVRSARAIGPSVCVAGTQPPNVRLGGHNKKTFLPRVCTVTETRFSPKPEHPNPNGGRPFFLISLTRSSPHALASIRLR